MEPERIARATVFRGSPAIPGDKSISHRALVLGALAEGRTEIGGLLESGDVESTARCLRALGVRIDRLAHRTVVEGTGALTSPRSVLDCGNSGTTLRVLMGVLAGRPLAATLVGDASLSRRPMRRVAVPLRLMGAEIALEADEHPPVRVSGAQLRGIDYALPVASAQVKTALLLAALTAGGRTRLSGRIDSRDHTERMLAAFGVEVGRAAGAIFVDGGQRLHAARVDVPGDPSTAAFFVAGAALVEGGHVVLERVSLNPTRTGLLAVLRRMGAAVEATVIEDGPEPIGRIEVRPGTLVGTTIEADEVPALVDELPLLAVVATQARGRTTVRGAEELRVKESDRIDAVAANLRALGGTIEVHPDGFTIDGPQALRGAELDSFHDHRIAMAFAIAGLVADGITTIRGARCVAISFPGFFEALRALGA